MRWIASVVLLIVEFVGGCLNIFACVLECRRAVACSRAWAIPWGWGAGRAGWAAAYVRQLQVQQVPQQSVPAGEEVLVAGER